MYRCRCADEVVAVAPSVSVTMLFKCKCADTEKSITYLSRLQFIVQKFNWYR